MGINFWGDLFQRDFMAGGILSGTNFTCFLTFWPRSGQSAGIAAAEAINEDSMVQQADCKSWRRGWRKAAATEHWIYHVQKNKPGSF